MGVASVCVQAIQCMHNAPALPQFAPPAISAKKTLTHSLFASLLEAPAREALTMRHPARAFTKTRQQAVTKANPAGCVKLMPRCLITDTCIRGCHYHTAGQRPEKSAWHKERGYKTVAARSVGTPPQHLQPPLPAHTLQDSVQLIQWHA